MEPFTLSSQEKTFELVVASVLLSLLLARIIYVFFDWISELVEEIVDPEVRHNYRKSKYYLVNAIVTSLFLGFVFILLHNYYTIRLGSL